MISLYVSGEPRWELVNKYGNNGKEELNTALSAHVLGLDVDQEEEHVYGRPRIEDGKLLIVFRWNKVWVNTDDGLASDKLLRAVSDTTKDDDGTLLSAVARLAIAKEFDREIEAVRKEVARILANPRLC